MTRIINNNDPGKERRLLTRAIVVAIRQFSQKNMEDIDSETSDIVVFITLSLEAICQTIERTTIAWEKRDYWLKADRFRSEWSWPDKFAKELRNAYCSQDWRRIKKTISDISNNLTLVEVSEKNRTGKPWIGFKDRFG